MITNNNGLLNTGKEVTPVIIPTLERSTEQPRQHAVTG